MTNSSAISESALIATDMPPATALLLPSELTVRVIINSPSCAITPRSSNFSAKSLLISKVALATALSLPCLTSAASAFPPRTRFSAVKIIVFPAPVSPVITVNPGFNSRFDEAITPMPLIETSLNLGRLLATPTLYR